MEGACRYESDKKVKVKKQMIARQVWQALT
jgi:hypothetical protein